MLHSEGKIFGRLLPQWFGFSDEHNGLLAFGLQIFVYQLLFLEKRFPICMTRPKIEWPWSM